MKLRLDKALLCHPKEGVRRCYFAAGAVVGVMEGVVTEAQLGAHTVGVKGVQLLERRTAAAGRRAARATTRLYILAGACAGLYVGSVYAAKTLWVAYTEDEVTLRLLRGSPIKYRDVEFKISPAGSAVSELNI